MINAQNIKPPKLFVFFISDEVTNVIVGPEGNFSIYNYSIYIP